MITYVHPSAEAILLAQKIALKWEKPNSEALGWLEQDCHLQPSEREAQYLFLNFSIIIDMFIIFFMYMYVLYISIFYKGSLVLINEVHKLSLASR